MFCAVRQPPVRSVGEKGELEEGMKEGGEEWRELTSSLHVYLNVTH